MKPNLQQIIFNDLGYPLEDKLNHWIITECEKKMSPFTSGVMVKVHPDERGNLAAYVYMKDYPIHLFLGHAVYLDDMDAIEVAREVVPVIEKLFANCIVRDWRERA